MTRNRVDNRAELIYNHLALHMGKGFTMPALCRAVGITDSATTRAAIRRARDLATEAGYHFPPAIAANGFEYRVTNLAEDALDPTLQMSRIETGVRKRKETGIEFMRRERKGLPSELRPIVDMHLTIFDATVKALGTIQAAADDMVIELVKARKRQRKDDQS